jgi:hypothetical protein
VISVQAIVLSLESLQIRRNHNSLKSLSFFFSPALRHLLTQYHLVADDPETARSENPLPLGPVVSDLFGFGNRLGFELVRGHYLGISVRALDGAIHSIEHCNFLIGIGRR